MGKKLFVFNVLAILVNIRIEAVAGLSLLIVNGTTAEEGEFPYMVQLRDHFHEFLCAGAILKPEWILTAGHCVDAGQITYVLYGSNMLNGLGYPNPSIRVKNWFQHPNFAYTDEGIPIYDVGLLQLESPIPLGKNAETITLADANATVPFHVQGVLAGWGVNETWGDLMPHLQKIYRTLLTDEECAEKINGYSETESFMPLHHLCSNDYYDGKCFGDSGAPLVINGTQYGLVSWSYKPCGIVPAAYTRITNPEYRHWIKSVTNT